MVKDIVISALLGRVQIGIIENGRLVEYYLERESKEGLTGNIYKGRVENILPGMEAAFVEIGGEKNAFLYVADITRQHSQVEIGDLLKKGDSILVQVSKEAVGTKGPRVTTNISIPGRYLVLLPHRQHLGISRQILEEKERARLKEIGEQIREEGMGLIVRTVAEGCEQEDLEEDLETLLAIWRQVQEKNKKMQAPALVYEDHDLVHRTLRDLLTVETRKIVVEGQRLYRQVKAEIANLGVNYAVQVQPYGGKPDLFAYLGLRKDLERARKRKVWLDCGGYLIFDQTEALLSVDVNTGKYVGGEDLRATVLKTNLEAAEEIAAQLRLRNVGGIVVIDFIDMPEDDRETVLQKLASSLERDKTQSNLFGFTALGLLEMTRRKKRKLLSDLLDVRCPHCQGTGRVIADETIALQIAGEVCLLARQDQTEAVLIKCHSAVGAQLIGPQRRNLEELEKETGIHIYVRGDDKLARHHYELVAGGKERTRRQAFPVRVGERLTVTVREPCAKHRQNGVARVNGFVIHCLQCRPLVGQRVELEIVEVHKTSAVGRLVE